MRTSTHLMAGAVAAAALVASSTVAASAQSQTINDKRDSKYLCSGKMTRKNGKGGSISYVIDRSCLKKAKSIKVQTGVYGFDGDPAMEDVTIFDESISASKTRSPSNTKWLKAS